jgi:hypothetical protein
MFLFECRLLLTVPGNKVLVPGDWVSYYGGNRGFRSGFSPIPAPSATILILLRLVKYRGEEKWR